MKFKKKLYLLPISILPAVGFSMTAVSCFNSNKKDDEIQSKLFDEILKDKFNIEKEKNNGYAVNKFSTLNDTLAKNHIYKIGMASEFKQNAYMADLSASYGNYLNKVEDNTIGVIVRKENLFRPIIEDNFDKTTGERTKSIKRPSVWRYKLELGAKVIITLKDGTVKTYDNDSIDIFPEPENVSENTYNFVSYQGWSNNATSINNKQFIKDLKNATKLQLTVKKDVKWQKVEGDKVVQTDYTVSVNDFYTSWLRTKNLSREVRKDLLEKSFKKGATDKAILDNLKKFVGEGFVKTFEPGEEPENIADPGAAPVKPSDPNQLDQYNKDYKKWAENKAKFENHKKWVSKKELHDTLVKVFGNSETEALAAFTPKKDKIVSLVADNIIVKQLDEKMQAINDDTHYFNDEKHYPNSYLYEFQDIDLDKTYNKDELITKVNGEEALTFNKLSSATTGQFDIFFDNLASSYDWVAAPDEFIKAKIGNEQIHSSANKNDEVANVKKTLKLIKEVDKDNELLTSGIYWYGVNYQDTLYVGHYVYLGYETSAQEEVWVKNTNYVDKDFANSKYNVNTIVRYWKNQMDNSQFQNAAWKKYKNGEISIVQFSGMSRTDKNELETKSSTYGKQFTQVLNTNELTANMGWNIIPGKTDSPVYNKVASHLLFGTPNADNGNISSEDSYVKLLSGTSVSFKSLLNAAINWEFIANKTSSNQSKTWINELAKDGTIGGSDQLTNPKKTPNEYYQELNVIKAYKEDGTLLLQITQEENEQYLKLENDERKKIKSAKHKELSEYVTALLDKFYKENGYADTEKVEFSYPWRYMNWPDPSWKEIFEELPQVINSLDKKNRISVKFIIYDKPSDKNLWVNALSREAAVTKFKGWAYDVNNIASGIDGIASTGFNKALLLIAGSEKLRNQLKAGFPEIVKLAEEFKTYLKEKSITLGVPLDKICKLTTNELSKYNDNSSSHIWNDSTHKLEETSTPQVDWGALRPKFLYWYAQKTPNDQLIELVNEIINFVGPVVDGKRSILKDNFQVTVVNPYILKPSIGSNSLDWISDMNFIYNPEK
ncbi:OppA family ABC transporter substrate-binding lipoprotein [Mycoplasma sp. Mirounga ES2805-ORL]|uniref:OppA family ABC transporter substrate-binding lipoprotein n=1 Tax=Mycoplasma sp. Mirounga ES2805-ORL TaxID=754514 RepID=UPI00197B14FC|nr:hypothetical protein [Mycoplasma sp. Mirounga ES2805-ORL]QSF13625.1 hypothetical protein JXZ90_03085 [Mycoplasma sp. Mirounga ES2805-ORL]